MIRSCALRADLTSGPLFDGENEDLSTKGLIGIFGPVIESGENEQQQDFPIRTKAPELDGGQTEWRSSRLEAHTWHSLKWVMPSSDCHGWHVAATV